MVHYLEVDLGGNLPNMLVQKVLNGEAYGLIAFKKQILKWLEKYGEKNRNLQWIE